MYGLILNKQQKETLELIVQSGNTGINTKQFRNYFFIQMPTTRVLEINLKFKEKNYPKKIKSTRTKDGTVTYSLIDFNWNTHLEEKQQPQYRWIFEGSTAKRVLVNPEQVQQSMI